jgi:hypothetical protein
MRALVLAILLAAAPGRNLLELDGSRRGGGLPPAWRIRAVKGQKSPTFTIHEENGQKTLRISGDRAAAWAHRRLHPPLSGDGRLRWSWRVLEQPVGADLRSRDTDDSALRVYVVFGGEGGFIGGRDRAIFYTWGNREPEGLTLPSFVSKRIQVVRVVGSPETDGSWRESEADPFADYRRFWLGEPPAITAVGIMQDTDATRARAVGEVRTLRWVPR